MTELVRLSKLMSERGLCSRREADKLIAAGAVLVNGMPVTQLGTKVERNVAVELSETGRRQQQQLVTIMLNKPVGLVSGQAEAPYRPAITLIRPDTHSKIDKGRLRLTPKHTKGLAPIGRLDIESQGLLLFSQDGRVAKRVIGEHTDVEKEYLVRVKQMVSDQQLNALRHGLSLDGQALKPARVSQINNDQLKFILKQGKKRQIRRMCDAVGLTVHSLKRVRIGQLKLGKLALGEWRFVGANEL